MQQMPVLQDDFRYVNSLHDTSARTKLRIKSVYFSLRAAASLFTFRQRMQRDGSAETSAPETDQMGHFGLHFERPPRLPYLDAAPLAVMGGQHSACGQQHNTRQFKRGN